MGNKKRNEIDTEIKKNSGIHAMIVYLNASAVIKTKVGKTIKENNLTSTQFRVLDVLYNLGTMPINSLLSKMLATSGNMTVVLKNMEKLGLIEKESCPTDKRKFMIKLTDEGKRLYEKVLPEHRKEVEELFSILTEKEKEDFINIMKKFKQYVDTDK